jgi:hypothetical protein
MSEPQYLDAALPLRSNREDRRLFAVQVKRAGGSLALLHVECVATRHGWMCPACLQFHPWDGKTIPTQARCAACNEGMHVICTLGGERGPVYFTIPMGE